jgi:hypothetical protein
MRHMDLIEIHDHPLFPTFLRNLATDALETLWNFSNSYNPILPRLRRAITSASSLQVAAGCPQVIDLCSGGGGPWPRINHELESAHQSSFRVCLTDKYPNSAAFKRVHETSIGCITFEPRSVDAAHVPPGLTGFRTIFSSFHHLSPSEARGALRDAVSSRQGIGIFELARPAFRTVLITCSVPFLTLFFTPRIQPFRWSRLLFTYIIPVVPLVLWFDGIVSCMRAYSHEELTQMIDSIPDSTYHWELGEERSGLLPVTYLIGCPAANQPS